MTKKISGIPAMALAFLFIGGGLTACKSHQKNSAQQQSSSAENTTTAAADTTGWVNLLQGDNLSQWHTFGKDQTDSCWSIQDGVVTLDHSRKGGGDLVTNKEYKNFVLSLEWKISNEGNSGIIFDAQEAPQYRATYVTGPEMQVLDNAHASDNKKDNHLAGSLYDLIPCDPATVHPAGEWNKIKIKQDNGKLTFWMNGHQVVQTQMGTPEWKKMIANSKFKHWKAFGTFLKGHIALQDHGHVVSYKNIRIKEL